MSFAPRPVFVDEFDLASVKRRWLEMSSNEPPEGYLERYFEHVSGEDVQLLGTEGMAGTAYAHWMLGRQREAGTSNIQVYNPTGDASSFAGRHTAIDIVTEDMPFLVGSVSAELTRQNRGIQLVIHPILVVRRTADGTAAEVLRLPADDSGLAPASGDTAAHAVIPDLAGAHIESWIHIEVDRVSESDLAALEDGIHTVLADVRASVDDWNAMTGAALQIANELETAPPAADLAAESATASRFLNWLTQGNFTFIGYREYRLETADGEDMLVGIPGTGLGVLRADAVGTVSALTATVQAKARERHVLVLTKANSRSTVNRRSFLDYVGVKVYNAAGEVTGERRFLGLFTSTLATRSVKTIPVIDEKARQILHRSGFAADSHSGKDLLSILETYPRDELFQSDVDQLFEIALAVVHLQERRRPRVFLRRDSYERFMSVLVYLPRDLYDTNARLRIESLLLAAFNAESVEYDVQLTESVLARLHFVVRVARGGTLQELDQASLQARIVEALRSWEDDLAELLAGQAPESELAARERVARWVGAFPESYKEDFDPDRALKDIALLEKAEAAAADAQGELQLRLYRPEGSEAHYRRFAFYRAESLSLTAILPYLSNLGAEVVDEKPHELTLGSGETRYIYDFGLRFADSVPVPVPDELFVEAFAAAWTGRSESDGYEKLVVTGGLSARDVVIIRTYARYLRQAGLNFSDDMIARVVVQYVDIARSLAEYFATRFDPARFDTAEARAEAEAARHAGLLEALEEVTSLDVDRILRAFVDLIHASVRTNFYQRDAHGKPKPYVSVKLDPASVDILPKPRPAFEMWVYSPRVEGVHLRFGQVARGGLRWSDRREDFRTEVLGLVKAQMVKNALIVPTGAKGGFFCKQLPDPSRRDDWLAEGQECYRTFIRGLLDVTDNLVYVDGGQCVAPPADVVRHDEDDTYLVVAADKGTASFSDIANEVSASYGFWLGDAFASGGSIGYDHKSMAITARGAWESVKRHFRELGTDIQREDFTVVGVGDMSGDVFGNGMLLSEHTRLVAAFDHRHIFLDPDPEAGASFAERRRLFELPRSSWADYDTELISAGGGVYPRTAKSIPVSAQVAERLGLGSGVTALAPGDLLRAILCAPVDLVYNGGIGTYIKAAEESNADVGDKANDSIRINGKQIRAKVVGEGGNLGVTQLGRIEAALNGTRINTDAIDNSAGVDCSDHEVNIKIFLDRLVVAGDISADDRAGLLRSMTDEVASLVLRHNYLQNMVLGDARVQTVPMTSVYARLMDWLEANGGLDRPLEFLPTSAELAKRDEGGAGLTSPELSVLLAYVKMAAGRELLGSELPDELWTQGQLESYFPSQLVERYRDRLTEHPLRREIIVTTLVNELVDRGGITFAHRLTEETGADTAQVLRVFTVASRIFGLDDYLAAIEATDGVVDVDTQITMQLEYRRLMDRATRWLVHHRPSRVDVTQDVARYRDVFASLIPLIREMVGREDREGMEAQATELMAKKVPEALAWRTATLMDEYPLLDIVDLAESSGEDPEAVARLYCLVSARFEALSMLGRIASLPRGDRWQALARGALRDDFYAAIESVTAAVLAGTGRGLDASARLRAWAEANSAQLSRVMKTVDEVRNLDHGDLASMSVALRLLRTVVRSSQGALAPATGMVPMIGTPAQ